MDSFASISECANYLSTKSAGTECTLTGGPATNVHIHALFQQRGVRVSVAGNLGSRTVMLVEVDRVRVEQLRAYKKSHALNGEYHISSVIYRDGGLDANVPTYVQGNHTTLVRQLRKYVGAGNYSVHTEATDPRGKGWRVTVAKEINLDMIFGGAK